MQQLPKAYLWRSKTFSPKETANSSDLDELRQTLHARLFDLRERYGVQWLGLFGSYVRGEQHAGSDLDVLLCTASWRMRAQAG